MSEEQTVLHFTRARAKGDSTFYDPQADIRAIFPTAVKITLDLLMDTVKDEKLKKEFEYLEKCYHIFQIRIAEDPSDLLQQVTDFSNAINKVRPAVRCVWQQALITLLNCLYSLFTRRDVKTDGRAIKGMLVTAQEAALLDQLPEGQQREVYQAFKAAGSIYEESPVIDPDGVIVCEETEHVLRNIKDIAQIFIPHTGPSDWHSLAKACDAFFKSPEAEKLTDEQQMAIALAYPDYETPYLTVEKTDD